jgi:hypothetical protein
VPIPNTPKFVNTFLFEDLGDGRTRVETRFGRPRSAKDRAIAEQLLPMFGQSFQGGMDALKPLIEADAAERAAAARTAAEEPALPAGQGRNVREPIAVVAG